MNVFREATLVPTGQVSVVQQEQPDGTWKDLGDVKMVRVQKMANRCGFCRGILDYVYGTCWKCRGCMRWFHYTPEAK